MSANQPAGSEQMARYYIEQAQDRFYQASELAAAKARAKRLSAKLDDSVYLIAEEYDPAIRDYRATGQVIFNGGALVANELAESA